ncbi:hypothetical protein DH2020_033832 [Rehmannia glutinosa]|uniref:Uncharacterized protein n=1 Tax=Rehmannia glutinosa TaxID=99300 RepID=A0ABR0VCV5_REHGL
MFCRLSIKDVKLNHDYRNPKPPAGEPSSPKVSCIGQVKRNNRVTGYPSAAAAAVCGGGAVNHHKHVTKRKKLFPTTAVINPSTAAASGGGGGRRSGSRSCRTRREMRVSNSRRSSDCGRNNRDFFKVVDIGEMDPPLPVVKRVAPPPGVGRDEVNIWKRRFNGVGLKSLQIEKIHLPNTKFQPPPTLTV